MVFYFKTFSNLFKVQCVKKEKEKIHSVIFVNIVDINTYHLKTQYPVFEVNLESHIF